MGMRRVLTCCAVVAGCVIVLVGCGSTATTPAATTSTATTAAGSSAAHTTSPRPTATHTSTPAHTAAAVGDVSCGPITAANGQTLTVVAKGSSAGVAGCSEAIDVLTEYFQRAAAESEGTAHELSVQGWRCSTIDNQVTSQVITGCDKQGLSIQAAG